MNHKLCSMFYVVEFPDEVSSDDGRPLMDVIPSCWFTSEEKLECYWPVGGNAAVSQAVKRRVKPDPSKWETCPVRVLGRSGNKNVQSLFNIFN